MMTRILYGHHHHFLSSFFVYGGTLTGTTCRTHTLDLACRGAPASLYVVEAAAPANGGGGAAGAAAGQKPSSHSYTSLRLDAVTPVLWPRTVPVKPSWSASKRE